MGEIMTEYCRTLEIINEFSGRFMIFYWEGQFMVTQQEKKAFSRLKEMYEDTYVIISPPRCGSTAFSRVFWEQPSIRYYSHEPFEVTYFEDSTLNEVVEKLEHPLDLLPIKRSVTSKQSSGLVIKEMPYQVGSNFDLLISLTEHPVIFLIRDPRLNIHSRITKKIEVDQDPRFPFVETGWELISKQVRYCQERSIPYLIIDSADFRSCPSDVFSKTFKLLHLPFSLEMLTWRSTPNVNLDNLGGHHSHLYTRVLESKGIEPAEKKITGLEEILEENGFGEHVVECMDIYYNLRLEAKKWLHCS